MFSAIGMIISLVPLLAGIAMIVGGVIMVIRAGGSSRRLVTVSGVVVDNQVISYQSGALFRPVVLVRGSDTGDLTVIGAESSHASYPRGVVIQTRYDPTSPLRPSRASTTGGIVLTVLGTVFLAFGLLMFMFMFIQSFHF
jgi:hypothetical protein